MALRELQKPIEKAVKEKNIDSFISKGGTLAVSAHDSESNGDEHRMTLRIPRHLVEKMDAKRKMRSGNVSRTLWVIEAIEKSVK